MFFSISVLRLQFLRLVDRSLYTWSAKVPQKRLRTKSVRNLMWFDYWSQDLIADDDWTIVSNTFQVQKGSLCVSLAFLWRWTCLPQQLSWLHAAEARERTWILAAAFAANGSLLTFRAEGRLRKTNHLQRLCCSVFFLSCSVDRLVRFAASWWISNFMID